MQHFIEVSWVFKIGSNAFWKQGRWARPNRSPLQEPNWCHLGLQHIPRPSRAAFSAFLYYSSSCCGDPPTIKLFSLLLHNCNSATVMNHNVNIWYAGYLIWGWSPQVGNHWLSLLCLLSSLRQILIWKPRLAETSNPPASASKCWDYRPPFLPSKFW